MVETADNKKSLSQFNKTVIGILNAIEGEYITIEQLSEILHIERNSVRWYLIRHGIPKVADTRDKRMKLVEKKAIIEIIKQQ